MTIAKLNVAFLAIAVVLTVYGGVILGLVPNLMPRKIKAGLAIDSPRAIRYQSWLNSTNEGVDTFYRWNFFNVTNADAVVQLGAMPIIEDVGPFVFRYVKYRPEGDVTWWPNGTLRYVNKWKYEFVPELSAFNTLDVPITTANLGILGMMQKAKTSPFVSKLFERASRSILKPQENFLGTRSAKDWLYGFHDPWLEFVRSTFCFDVLPSKDWELALACWILFQVDDITAPVTTTVAISPNYDWSNQTKIYDEIYSGGPASVTMPQPPAGKFLQYTMWNGHRTYLPSDWWATPYARMINGTDGASFHPDLQEGETVYAFVGSLHRSVPLCYNGRSKVNDLEVFDFMVCDWSQQNSTVNPDNAAFYMDEMGLLVPPPPLELPIFNSQPYYYKNEQRNVKLQMPAHPDPMYLETLIHIEPTSGQTVKARKALQVNVNMTQWFLFNSTQPVDITANLNQTYLPVAWMNEYVDLSAHTDKLLFDHVILPGQALIGSAVAALALAVVALLFVASRAICKNRQQALDSKEEQLPLNP